MNIYQIVLVLSILGCSNPKSTPPPFAAPASSGFGLTDVFATDIDQTMTVFNFQRERFYPEAYVRAEAKAKEVLGGDPGRTWQFHHAARRLLTASGRA